MVVRPFVRTLGRIMPDLSLVFIKRPNSWGWAPRSDFGDRCSLIRSSSVVCFFRSFWREARFGCLCSCWTSLLSNSDRAGLTSVNVYFYLRNGWERGGDFTDSLLPLTKSCGRLAAFLTWRKSRMLVKWVCMAVCVLLYPSNAVKVIRVFRFDPFLSFFFVFSTLSLKVEEFENLSKMLAPTLNLC